MKHDQIAKECTCGVNSLPLSFADLTGRGLHHREKGERQKKGKRKGGGGGAKGWVDGECGGVGWPMRKTELTVFLPTDSI